MAIQLPLNSNSFVPAFDPWQLVSFYAPFLRVVHHIPGRVRLKVDLAAFEGAVPKTAGVDQLKKSMLSVRGVRNVGLNLLARSCVIEYDSQIIPQAAWDDLLAVRDTAAARVLIDILKEKHQEISHGQL